MARTRFFSPLAFTKTFALVGVALLSITLVPALIPIFLRGRIKSEDENWLVRTMIEIFKPMLSWLMDRTTLVCWLFAVIVGFSIAVSLLLGAAVAWYASCLGGQHRDQIAPPLRWNFERV